MAIFDDTFVDENVYSGLSVEPGHRQNLHELVVGSQGVHLHQRLQAQVARISEHNAALRGKADAIPVEARGDLSIDAFCGLRAQAGVDAVIEAAERALAAARQQDPVRNGVIFQTLTIPAIDLPGVEGVLQRHLPDLDTAAAVMVQAHLEGFGREGEAWVAEGLHLLPIDRRGQSVGPCPFCAQDLAASAVMGHYAAFFSDAYRV